jgi:hypothetical protein
MPQIHRLKKLSFKNIRLSYRMLTSLPITLLKFQQIKICGLKIFTKKAGQQPGQIFMGYGIKTKKIF